MIIRFIHSIFCCFNLNQLTFLELVVSQVKKSKETCLLHHETITKSHQPQDTILIMIENSGKLHSAQDLRTKFINVFVIEQHDSVLIIIIITQCLNHKG